MERWRDFLETHWFDGLLLLTALVFGARAWRRRRGGAAFVPSALTACALALAALGGVVLPPEPAFWVSVAAAASLFGAFLVVVISGRWSAPLGFALGAVLLFGLGGLCSAAVGEGLVAVGKTILNLEVLEPAWLVLLAVVPVIVWLSFRSLSGLGPVRRWLAIGLRCLLVIFLVLALAEVRLRHPNENVTVLFLVDRSLNVPKEWEADPSDPKKQIDRRWERVRRFINEAVEFRGPGHKADRAGVVVFGRRPRLELPPAEVKRLNFQEVLSPVDTSYTDIGAALKMALASFPEGTGKRIVLVSDGNENLGNAEEQARIAKNNGVQIDSVPLAPGYRDDNEVLVLPIEAPTTTALGSQIPIRVLVRSNNPNIVLGEVRLVQKRQVEVDAPKVPDKQVQVIGAKEDEKKGGTERQIAWVDVPVPPFPMPVVVRPGLNAYVFKQQLSGKDQSYKYEAKFTPTRVVDEAGRVLTEGLPGDRTENNVATTHVIARGQRRVLFVEGKQDEHRRLVENLRTLGRGDGGKSKFEVIPIVAAQLPQNKDDLGVLLSKYDCVVLANVPADLLTDEQQEMIRSNTHEQGCGLIMIGGPESFGAGGWQSTPVEKALPVDCDIKALKIQGKGGLVLIMHASELDQGNVWQKKIAQLAIKKLSPADEIGVLQFSWGVTKWHIPFQTIGSKRDTLLKLVDTMQPEDMPEFDSGLRMAYEALTDPKRDLATKHVIIISDGDPVQQDANILAKMREKKVTVTTVGVATHGAPQDQAMGTIAKATGGRYYKVTNPKALPAIYVKETRLVSQSFVYEKKFGPQLQFKSGPTEKLPDTLPALYGYVRTTRKPAATVQVPILAPAVGEQEFPILAYWHYGLGKSVAFTSDARSQTDKPYWDRDWASSEMYLKFWEQVLDWSLRAVETGKMTMTTEVKDGRVRVVVEARDADGKPLTDLRLRGGVTTPGGPEGGGQAAARTSVLKFEQKNSGLYEAEFKADESGSYFINAQARRPVKKTVNGKEEEVEEGVDSVRSGVTIPYSPEFADLTSNAPLLERLSALTGGKVYPDSDAGLAEAARSGDVFRLNGLPPAKNLQPIWYWLLLFTGIGLFFDVAVRRLALDPREVAGAVERGWGRLRGRAVAAAVEAPFLARLQNRKAQVAETLERSRGQRRFEAPEEPVTAAPVGAHEVADRPQEAPRRPTPQPQLAPKPEEQADDFGSRLLKAKKKVWEERDK